MSVVINGENREITSPQTVTALLADLGLDSRKIALEHNLEIVPRSAYDQTMVADGDRLEIVHLIGGGDEGIADDLDRGWIPHPGLRRPSAERCCA